MIIRYLLKTAGVLFLIITAPVLFAEAAPEEEAGATAEAARTVTHALGTIGVPESVERVIAIDWDFAEMVLALGMQPVGVADIGGYEKWVDVPAALDGSVVDVGRRQEPNLERIAELRPDLIITSTGRAANNYDALNAIAPALMFNMYPEDGSSHYEAMLSAFRAVAEALNREEAGDGVHFLYIAQPDAREAITGAPVWGALGFV